MKKNAQYWNEVLSAINKQKGKAILLLTERHGDDFSQPLAEKFRRYSDLTAKLNVGKGIWFGIEDLPVKDWYFETNAILENYLNQNSDCLKKFKKTSRTQLR